MKHTNDTKMVRCLHFLLFCVCTSFHCRCYFVVFLATTRNDNGMFSSTENSLFRCIGKGGTLNFVIDVNWCTWNGNVLFTPSCQLVNLKRCTCSPPAANSGDNQPSLLLHAHSWDLFIGKRQCHHRQNHHNHNLVTHTHTPQLRHTSNTIIFCLILNSERLFNVYKCTKNICEDFMLSSIRAFLILFMLMMLKLRFNQCWHFTTFTQIVNIQFYDMCLLT